MRKNTTDEQRMRTPFGRYVNTINNETDYDDNDEIFSDKDTEEYAEEEEIYEEPVKPIKNKRFKKNKKVTENVPETQPIWTGQTTAIDIIAPTSVDNGSRDYVVVDGIYHSYLYIAGYGYRTHNEAAWMSALVEAGDSIGISFSFKRMQKDKILSRIAQKTMINRSKMRDVADTRSDFEELDSAISSGIYLKEGMNRGNQDFYYMSTVIEVTAEDEETLERNVSDVITLCASMDMVCKRADYKHEQGFLSLLPTVSLDADLERKSRRNVLTDSLAAAFPFSSFEVYDPEGIFIGLNKYNNSVAILDFFDADKYSNANACILGMTGAGKTFLMQIMALRLRQQGIQVFILAPLKGHEFAEVCNMIGGKYIRIAPSSMDCINIMEIRKRTLNTNYEIHGVRRNDSILAEKIQNLIIFFSLIKNDITQNELNLIDGAIVRTYKTFGITYDNDSLFDKDGRFKKMPTLKDLYNELLSKDKTKDLALMIEKFAVGSLSTLGGSTNVDLDNKYIVLDISEMNEHLKALGMFIALDFVWDKAKENRTAEKAIFVDECWQLIGASSNRQAAESVLELAKTIRGYGGSLVCATQDLNDFFALDDGKYGKGIINNSKTKILLNLEEEEAQRVQGVLHLSEAELMEITHFERGSALISTNNNNIAVEIKCSQMEKELITTDRRELAELAQRAAPKQHPC